MVLYLVHGDVRSQNYEDLNDLCKNIRYFNPEAKIIINHPEVDHPDVLLRYRLHEIDTSRHVFGVFVELLKYLKQNPIKFDHVSWISANQYMINNFKPEKHVNYLQFFNHPEWEYNYTGKDYPNRIFGRPYEGMQYEMSKTRNEIYDPKDYYKELGIENPMCHNWEFAFLTKKAIDFCQKNIDRVCDLYPIGEYGCDRSMSFAGYMALLTKQEWRFPPIFGTYDPSNKLREDGRFSKMCTLDQIIQKRNEGYASVKRVNYKMDCPLKDYIRTNFMK
jgi:hypothetical protein